MMTDHVFVDTPEALHEACAELAGCDAIGVDTEFERTRTFYARPALMQLSDGERAWLVDPLAIDDLAPLGELLARPQTVKVLHACSEDLEVLERSAGARPTPLFDTQVAAALTGHGFSLAYRALVSDLLGVTLDKDASRSDWLRRPLSPHQLDYAARDTIHLVPMHRILTAALDTLGRSAWCEEECARIVSTGGSAPPPEAYYKRVQKARELGPRELARLRALCAWREHEARRRDVARKHVLEDAVLLSIAREAPADRAALAAIEEMPRRAHQRYADALLGALAAAQALPEQALPEPISVLDPRDASRRAKGLRPLVNARAQALGIAPEYLLQRRLAVALLEHLVTQGARELPDELRGWRRGAIVEEALDVLRASA